MRSHKIYEFVRNFEINVFQQRQLYSRQALMVLFLLWAIKSHKIYEICRKIKKFWKNQTLPKQSYLWQPSRDESNPALLLHKFVSILIACFVLSPISGSHPRSERQAPIGFKSLTMKRSARIKNHFVFVKRETGPLRNLFYLTFCLTFGLVD